MNTTTCFAPAHILLPAEQIPLEQWGCIACDQFTSDRKYWQRAKEAADGSPSTLNLILPEVYLEDGDADARWIWKPTAISAEQSAPCGPARARWRAASRPA